MSAYALYTNYSTHTGNGNICMPPLLFFSVSVTLASMSVHYYQLDLSFLTDEGLAPEDCFFRPFLQAPHVFPDSRFQHSDEVCPDNGRLIAPTSRFYVGDAARIYSSTYDTHILVRDLIRSFEALSMTWLYFADCFPCRCSVVSNDC